VNGQITVLINKKQYKVLVNDGKATVVADNVVKGENTIEVSYAGDDKYNKGTNSTTFNADAVDAEISIDKNVIPVGDDLVINLPKDAKGNVTVSSGILSKTVDVKDGKAIISTKGLPAGVYPVQITYNGDDKYANESIKDTVYLQNDDYSLNVAAEDIFIGEEAIIRVNLPKDATGIVFVTVDGVKYNVSINKGVGNLVVPGLKLGKHNVKVEYPGDNTYTSKSNSTTFNVVRYNPEISLDKNTVKKGENFVVTLPKDATGTVTAVIGGKTIRASVNNGQAVISTKDVPAGAYSAKFTYGGDGKYNARDLSANVKVQTDDYSITVSAKDITVGDKAVITVTLPSDATGSVSIVVNGKTYTAAINNGKATLDVSGLTKGTYPVTASYAGNDKYLSKSNTTSFNVKALDPSINLAKDTVKKGENLVIELPGDATGTVTAVIGGKTITAPVNNGKAVISTKDVPAGKYSAKFTYSGDSKYNARDLSANVKVQTDDYSITVSAKDISAGDKAVITVTLPSDATGSVSIVVNGKTYTAPINKGKATLEVSGLAKGTYTVTASYAGNDKYLAKSASGSFNVKGLDPSISLAKDTVKQGEDLVVNLPADATGTVTATIGGKTITAPVNNGKAVISTKDIAPGKYSAKFAYSGDSKYNSKDLTANVNVESSKVDPSISLVKDTVKQGEDLVVQLPGDATGTVTAVIGGKTISAPVNNGKAVIPTNDIAPGKYSAKLSYSGDSKYNSKDLTANVNVESADPVDYSIIVSAKDINVGDKATITVTLPSDATGSVSIVVNGKTYTASVNKGKATLDVSGLAKGTYTVTASYAGDSKYVSKSNSTGFNVKGLDPSIGLAKDAVKQGEDLVITLPGDAKGNVTAVIGGKTVTVPVKDGKAVITTADIPVGQYDAKITYSGDDKYNAKDVSAKVSIVESLIIAPDVVKYFKGPERFVVSVIDTAGRPVSGAKVVISINGKPYEKTTDDEGKASIGLNLISGVYKVTSVYGDDEVNSTVTVKPTVVADNVVKMYRNGTQYYATFTDSNGNLLKNTKVNFNINGVFYERVTNESGVARMNINLNPNKYILTATNPVTGEMCSSNITVLPTIVENHDLTKYYKNDSCYTLKILDDQGNPAAGVTVKLNINGVFYERVTNESGYINFKINLIPGTYTVTAEYKGLKASNTVKVLPVLTAKDISMRYHDGTKFEAKLVDGQGKPFANPAITFNINGVFYNKNTDANGIARLNINLMVGEYIITSAYSPIGAALSNKITIRN